MLDICRCEQFMDWFLSSVSKDNVLTDAELEAYAAIPEEARLSGKILDEALATIGDTDLTGAKVRISLNVLLGKVLDQIRRVLQ